MSNRLQKEFEKIMVFGVFDGLHPGHLNFFKQARRLSKHPWLIVSVARDKNVLKIKGSRPKLDERKRKKEVMKSKLMDRVLLGGIKDHLSHILKEKPDIIALGYDQRAYVRNLKKDLKNQGLLVKIVRLKPYKEKIYKSSLLNYLTSSRRRVIQNPRRRIPPRTKNKY